MAYPTTAVLDDFNRANEGPPPSASWTGAFLNANTLTVASNVCKNAGAQGDAYWNPTTYGPDSEAYATRGDAFTDFYIVVRLANPGAGTCDGYMAFYFDGSGILIYRIDNGAITQLGATVSSTLAAGDALGVSIVGSTISVYSQLSGVWGAALATRTDSTYSAAGYVGVGVNASGKIDDFGGGTVVAPTATPPIPIVVDTAVDRAANY